MISVPYTSPVDRTLEYFGYQVSSGLVRDYRLFWHWHRGIEVVFVHSGLADAYSRTWRRTLRSGDLILNNGQIDHGSTGTFNRTVVHFMPDLVPAEARSQMSTLLEADGYIHTTINPGSATRIIWATQELSALRKQRGRLASVKALVGVVAAEIETAVNQPCDAVSINLVYAIIDYMRANITSGETLDLLAERFSISARHLHHLFKEHFGCSPWQYWLSLKLKHACHLLAGDQPIQDISTTVGFQSLRGFQRAFQRAYHVTPSAYRVGVQSHISRSVSQEMSANRLLIS